MRPLRAEVGPSRLPRGMDIRSAIVNALEQCPLLYGLDTDAIERIADECRTAEFQAQEQIFDEGQPCDGLWILMYGRARLYHSDAEGHQQIVGFRGPSSPLELAAALDGRPYGSSATALDDSMLIFLPRPMLSSVSRSHPITVRNVLDQLCLELRQRDIATAIATLRNARGRICCALLQIARQYGVRTPGGEVRIDYRLTRQDIADRSGVTLETAIRVLSDFQRQGIIRTQSQVIEILSVSRLSSTAECHECQLDCSVFAPNPRQRLSS